MHSKFAIIKNVGCVDFYYWIIYCAQCFDSLAVTVESCVCERIRYPMDIVFDLFVVVRQSISCVCHACLAMAIDIC